MAAVDRFTASDPVRRRLRRLTRAERWEEAAAFLRQVSWETGIPDATRKQRESNVKAAIFREGHYDHTPEELAFGARLAWRNHARCSGRLTWKSLRVVDRRETSDAQTIVDTTLYDVIQATGSGRIRPSISIYAPATEKTLPATFESSQLFQYAGYPTDNGEVIGDRSNIELTRIVERMGWSRPNRAGPFDLLPVVMRSEAGSRLVFTIPQAAAREVVLRHPECPAFDALELRWYAIPCVTNMVLCIGGIEYPCAPFNGHYLCTEIASRNLVDRNRYDLLRKIADAFASAGLFSERTGTLRPLWRDTSLTELNRAVLFSFDNAGMRIADHHELSGQHMEFARREERAGRAVSGEWSWIVPPQASAVSPTFHLPMTNLQAVPNFYHSRARDGSELRVNRTHLRDGPWRDRFERMKRRYRAWRRRRDRFWQQ